MNQTPLYPIRFEPIYQYRLWGGRRMANLLSTPLPEGPVGEAWILSDRDDHPSIVADGELKGKTIGQVISEYPEGMLGDLAGKHERFPLLLKFLDAAEVLSVQVHPSDNDKQYLPKGELGKTEAWVVLERGPEGRIYAGLNEGVTSNSLRESLTTNTASEQLSSFEPQVGEGILLRAGTVHTFGDLVVFEVQQNSDVTFRLYDWDRVDATTGKPRPLQVEAALACIDFTKGPMGPAVPIEEEQSPVHREQLFTCEFFEVTRFQGSAPFTVGKLGKPRVIVCLDGGGKLEVQDQAYPVQKGDVVFLPAAVGECSLAPNTEVNWGHINVLEISLPEDE